MKSRNDNRRGNDNRHRDGFIDSVLSRTTGQACERALGQLDELMDNQLQAIDRQLVQAHLEHCDGCRGVAVTVGWLQPLLPDMAEVEISPEFLAGVLARTSQVEAPRNLSLQPTGVAGLMDRAGQWWQDQIMRPGFAFQAAYVVTVIVVILVYTTPLRTVPGQALDLVSAGPPEMPLVGALIDDSSQWLEGETNRALAAGRSQVQLKKERVATGLRERILRTADSREQLIQHLDNALHEAGARSAVGVSRELVGVLQTSRTVWSLWLHAAGEISEADSETTSGQ